MDISGHCQNHLGIIAQRRNELQDQFERLGDNSKFHMDINKIFPFLNNEDLNKIAFEYYVFQLNLVETPHILDGYVDFGMSEETMLIIKKYIYAK